MVSPRPIKRQTPDTTSIITYNGINRVSFTSCLFSFLFLFISWVTNAQIAILANVSNSSFTEMQVSKRLNVYSLA